MKSFVLIFLFIGTVSLCQASKLPKYEVNKAVIHLMLHKYVQSLRGAGITANLNEFAEKLFTNIETYAVANGFDPSPLNNVSANLVLVDVELTNGTLHGISTLDKYDDVLVSYTHDDRTLTITLPITFTKLGFEYNYALHIMGIGPSGTMDGQISKFKFYLELCFDIANLEFSIKELRTTDSGHISVHWHGNITDIILNILSEFVTTILHPLIQGVIEGIIKTVASRVVDDINQVLYDITHPSNTTINISDITKFTQYSLN
ncbi:uncharacterized protein LOC130898389 [Diorhabda carinulata]|uniref:uncharacterized protein LOC130898389 n=1 Tax=Diorhabda carinulata TaxID=1163345 RepID=UPI0025A1DB3A|nr:uncharacterized protein LOC130898389 [Diorhabda carinulata]